MGKEIEQAAIERGHIISQTFSSGHPFGPNSNLDVDVAIEFSKPELAVEHMRHCLSNGVPVVVGTTGWSDQLPAIKTQVEQHKGSLLHASNFSLGVHLFWSLSKKLSQLMNGRNDYNASITEIHHTLGDRYCSDEYWRQPHQGRHDRSSRWGKCGGLWKPSSPFARHDGDYHSDHYELLQK